MSQLNTGLSRKPESETALTACWKKKAAATSEADPVHADPIDISRWGEHISLSVEELAEHLAMLTSEIL